MVVATVVLVDEGLDVACHEVVTSGFGGGVG